MMHEFHQFMYIPRFVDDEFHLYVHSLILNCSHNQVCLLYSGIVWLLEGIDLFLVLEVSEIYGSSSTDELWCTVALITESPFVPHIDVTVSGLLLDLKQLLNVV